jgi:hypothetical protein
MDPYLIFKDISEHNDRKFIHGEDIYSMPNANFVFTCTLPGYGIVRTNPDRITDLLAYLDEGGNETAALYLMLTQYCLDQSKKHADSNIIFKSADLGLSVDVDNLWPGSLNDILGEFFAVVGSKYPGTLNRSFAKTQDMYNMLLNSHEFTRDGILPDLYKFKYIPNKFGYDNEDSSEDSRSYPDNDPGPDRKFDTYKGDDVDILSYKPRAGTESLDIANIYSTRRGFDLKNLPRSDILPKTPDYLTENTGQIEIRPRRRVLGVDSVDGDQIPPKDPDYSIENRGGLEIRPRRRVLDVDNVDGDQIPPKDPDYSIENRGGLEIRPRRRVLDVNRVNMDEIPPPDPDYTMANVQGIEIQPPRPPRRELGVDRVNIDEIPPIRRNMGFYRIQGEILPIEPELSMAYTKPIQYIPVSVVNNYFETAVTNLTNKMHQKEQEYRMAINMHTRLSAQEKVRSEARLNATIDELTSRVYMYEQERERVREAMDAYTEMYNSMEDIMRSNRDLLVQIEIQRRLIRDLGRGREGDDDRFIEMRNMYEEAMRDKDSVEIILTAMQEQIENKNRQLSDSENKIITLQNNSEDMSRRLNEYADNQANTELIMRELNDQLTGSRNASVFWQNEVERLRKDQDSINLENRSLNARLLEYENRITAAAPALSSFDNLNKEYRDYIQRAEESNRELVYSNKLLSDEIERRKMSYNAVYDSLNETSKSFRDLQNEMSNARGIIEENEFRYKRLEDSYEAIKRELVKSEQTRQEYLDIFAKTVNLDQFATIDQIAERMTEITNSYSKSRVEIASLKQANDDLTVSVRNLENDTESSKKADANKIKNLEDMIRNLEQDLSESTGRIKEHVDMSNEAASEINLLKDIVKDLNKKLDRALNENSKYAEENKRVQELRGKLIDEVRQKTITISQLTDLLDARRSLETKKKILEDKGKPIPSKSNKKVRFDLDVLNTEQAESLASVRGIEEEFPIKRKAQDRYYGDPAEDPNYTKKKGRFENLSSSLLDLVYSLLASYFLSSLHSMCSGSHLKYLETPSLPVHVSMYILVWNLPSTDK